MVDQETFIEQLIIKANPDIDDEGLDMLVEDVKPVLIDRVMTNIASMLTEEQLKWFNELFKKNGIDNKMYDYLAKEIPGYERFIDQVYDDFEKMYLEEYKRFQKDSK